MPLSLWNAEKPLNLVNLVLKPQFSMAQIRGMTVEQGWKKDDLLGPFQSKPFNGSMLWERLVADQGHMRN